MTVASSSHTIGCMRAQFLTSYTMDWEIFTLKIIRVKIFRVDKFSRFRSILEIFLRKCFIHVLNFCGWSQPQNYFNSEIFLIYSTSIDNYDKSYFVIA